MRKLLIVRGENELVQHFKTSVEMIKWARTKEVMVYYFTFEAVKESWFSKIKTPYVTVSYVGDKSPAQREKTIAECVLKYVKHYGPFRILEKEEIAKL